MTEIPQEALQAAPPAPTIVIQQARDEMLAFLRSMPEEARVPETLAEVVGRLVRIASTVTGPYVATQVRRQTAQQIAEAIQQRGSDQALDCWCHDTYADLARKIGEADADA